MCDGDGSRSEGMNDRKEPIACDENLNILTITWATSSTSTWALVAAACRGYSNDDGEIEMELHIISSLRKWSANNLSLVVRCIF